MDGLTVAERRFDSTNTEVYTMRYYFDESNAPIGIGIQYPSSADAYWDNYYFAKNLQGDIIAIYNNNGGEPNLIATYEYDAWGRPLSIRNASGVEIAPNAYHVGLLNPFRYRGYRYDGDTGFYYLQSRYYDPVIGRFINADGLASTGQGFIGYNMFAYCNNNPVNCVDYTGDIAGWAILGIVVGCLAIVGIDHYLAKHMPDGIVVEHGEDKESGINVDVGYAKGSGFKCDRNGITLCDTEVGLMDSYYKKNNLEVGFFNVFSAAAIAEVDWSGHVPSVDISAVASIYTADFEYTVSILWFDITVSGALHVGAVGAGAELDPDSGKLKFTAPGAGVIPTIGIDVDLK